jgi:RHS repeat-associated protein
LLQARSLSTPRMHWRNRRALRRATSGRSFYNYFRDYDPSAGRYLQSDPLGLTAGVNTYSYVNSSPIGLSDPLGLVPGCGPDRCAQLRARILANSAKLTTKISKYNPIADARGGFPTWGGKLTKPGGHYKQILELQGGLKKDIAEYKRLCSNKDGWPPIPRTIDEQASSHVEAPIITPAPGISPELPEGANLVAPTAGMIVLLLALNALLN